MKSIFVFLAQLFFIVIIYATSDYIVDLFHLPIPTSVFGMILLYILLLTGIIQVRYIDRAATFLNKHLAFFFIPFAVGLMNYEDLIKTSGLQIMLMITLSSIIGLLVTAGLTKSLSRKEEIKREQSDSH